MFNNNKIVHLIETLSLKYENAYWICSGKLSIGSFLSDFIERCNFLVETKAQQTPPVDCITIFYREILLEFNWRCGAYILLSLKSEYTSLRTLESRYIELLNSNCFPKK